MKRNLLCLTMLLALLWSCKDKTSESKQKNEPHVEDVEELSTSYPEALEKIFEAHGGLETWEEMETLEFSMEQPDGYEITTTDLKDRYALVEMPEHTIGFDGDSLWTKSKNEGSFKESPETYYNYMFQFYAMPFILSDESSSYKTIAALDYNGKNYPGLHVVFNNHGLTSVKDVNVYYDPESYYLTWLSFVNSNKGSKDQPYFIHYQNWQEVEGLSLPETMVWYTSKNNQPGTKEKEIKFVSPMLTTVKMEMRVFAKPEDAEMVQ